MSYMSLPTKYQTSEYSDNLVKVFIRVMHDKDNFNGSFFSLESIDKAKESLKNIPILAYIKEKEDGTKDFDEHNVEISVDFDGEEITLNEKFLEQPIGVIPESTQVTIENIDGYNYLCCEGYIWKNYSNEAFDILSQAEEKKVSMEIKVNQGNFKDDLFHITDYQYLGVTILGDDTPPAMGDNCIISMNYSANNKEFYKAVEDLNKELKSKLQESEVQEMDKVEKTLTETVPTNEEIVVEETVEVEGAIENEKDFANKKKRKGSSQSSGTSKCDVDTDISTPDEEETSKEDEEAVVTEPTKEVVETEEETSKEATIEEVVVEEATQEEVVEETTECEAQPEIVSNIFSISKEEYDALINELNELKEFKSNILRQERVLEVDNIVSEFAFEESEVADLRDKAINEEITLEQLKKELFAIEGMKAFSSKKKFKSESNQEPASKIVVTNIGGSEIEPYDGLFTKYKK